jgi:phospholipid-transporting ATPase
MVINEDSLDATQKELENRLNKIVTGKSPATTRPRGSTTTSPPTTLPASPPSNSGRSQIGDLALIIDGNTLHYALTGEVKHLLLELAKMCKAVICCRVSPLQKADVVTLVRENLDAISLAIGDGANDVSMIQAAHVGVGISGEEGLQAARASDYAIAQFRFLQRLLFIHGRHSYRRISKVILYSFYKNVALYIVQFWFTIHNGWSGQTFFERTTLTAYNIAWTLLPVVAVGVFDKDISDRKLLEHPQLYQTGVRRYYYNYRVFWGWVLNALYHSFICYWFVELTFVNQQPYHDGRTMDIFSMGSVSFTCVVVVVTLKLGLETRYWTWVNHFTVWGSIIAYACWLMVYGVFFDGTSMGADLYRTVFQLYHAGTYYLDIVFVIVLCLARDVLWKFFTRTDLPQSYHIVQELQAIETKAKRREASAKKIYTGYSFSQDSSEADEVRHYRNSKSKVQVVQV